MPDETPSSDYLYRAIDSVDRKVSEGLSRIENEIKETVHRGEFAATIARLDAQDRHLDERMTQGFDGLGEKIDGWVRTTAEAERRRDLKNHWILGGTIAGAGAISGIVFGILSLLF